MRPGRRQKTDGPKVVQRRKSLEIQRFFGQKDQEMSTHLSINIDNFADNLRIPIIGLALLLGVSALHAADQPSNVLIILADDLGFSDLGCYGSEIATPNLDSLASGGLRFTQMYNTGRCWPSRAALLTGYYPQAVRRDAVEGVPSGSNGVRPGWAPLLPELLAPLGYRSYHSGKWHVDSQPLKSGFLHSYQIEGGQNNYFKTRGITDDGEPVAQTEDYYVTTAIGDHAVRCLREHAEKHAKQSFFHYVCFTSPHFPLHAPAMDLARYRERYRQGWEVIQRKRYERMKELGIVSHELPAMEREVGPPYAFPDAFKKLGPGEVNRPLAWSDLTAEQQAFQADKMSVHAAMIDRMDEAIGRIVAQLKASGMLENTLILFASDNGASAEIMVRGDGHNQEASPGSAETYLCLGPGWSSAANTPLRRHKTWVHEGGISTPLIAHWPKGIAARGELRHTPAHLIDIVPTVIDLAGGDLPEKWHGEPVPKKPGISLTPLFAKKAPLGRECLWWRHEGNRAVRVDDWKLVAAGKAAKWELYNIAKDRGEEQNLAEKMPEKVRELAALWEKNDGEYSRLASHKPSVEK
jgi:arylsulfatase